MLILRDAQLRMRILRTAGPAMLEMIMYMVIGLADVAFVGRLGAAPLAAVGLAAEIFFALILCLEALAMGATILVAQARGAGRTEEADRITGYTLLIGLVLGLVIAYIGLKYASPIIGLFAVAPEVHRQAVSYLRITFFISPLALGLYMSNSVFRGLGRTDIPMAIALMQNVVNVLGDYVLVYGKWGFPQMGVAGAALATSIAHVLGFMVVFYLLLSGRGGIRIRFKLLRSFDTGLLKRFFTLGMPSLGEQAFNTLSTFLSMSLLVYTGTLAFASHEVAVTMESVSFMPGIGVAIAATALVGQAVGARDSTAARRAARGSMELALVLMGMLGLIFALFPRPVAMIFTNDQSIIPVAATLIRIAALEQLTIAFTMVGSGIIKGTGNTRLPLIVTTCFTWLYRLPLMYLLIKVLHMGISVVWLLFISDWLLRALTYAFILQRDTRKRLVSLTASE